jgi:flagellin
MDAVTLGLAENATGEDATAAVITGNVISEILGTDINLGTITVNEQEVELNNVNDLDGSGEEQITIETLADALETDINAVLGANTVKVTGADGVLTIETVAKGSEASLKISGDAATALGIAGIASGKDATDGLTNIIDVSNRDAADAAIATIDAAVGLVSTERSNLGSVQNRLEHTINNLTATAENLSAAESRIRDVDMAEEMMEFTKNNILSQAATAMLAQANQMPNSVLQLLQ